MSIEHGAVQTMRNPSLARVITHLQHASLVLPWAARIAAAQALAKLAVRSEEPYRMQCYAILTALVAADGATSHDTIGEGFWLLCSCLSSAFEWQRNLSTCTLLCILP